MIVLADSSNASDDPDDLDARSLLTTLAVESMNPSAYTCVEVVKSENRQHFERTHADELVVSAELTGSLLAASARSHGITDVVADLLTHPEGQELYRIPVPPELAGQSVRDAIEVAEGRLRLAARRRVRRRPVPREPAVDHDHRRRTASCSWCASDPSTVSR